MLPEIYVGKWNLADELLDALVGVMGKPLASDGTDVLLKRSE